jgi:hypothetical protein
LSQQVFLKASAAAELREAAVWYESRSPGTGERFVASVQAALGILARLPLAAPVWISGRPYRRQVVDGFPFVIFFRE